jgi:phage minor structural protein
MSPLFYCLERRISYLYTIDRTLKPKRPRMFLCRPSGEIIGILKDATFPDHRVMLGKLNEITFEVPYDVERNHQIVRNPLVDHIRDRYLIKLVLGESTEYYFINELNEDAEESSDKKRVHAFSLGYELNDKLIREYEVTSKNATQVLADALGETIWSIGYIDVDFDIKYRSFEVPEKTVLDFVFEIAETFGSVVEFDTINRKIHLKKQESIGTDSGFRIGYGKYARSLSKNSKSDEQVTQFEPYGENGLSIRRVNPTGSSFLLNFSYFLYPFQRDTHGNTIQSSYYMSDGLCHAILDYQDLVEEKKTEFSTLLTQKETLQTTYATKSTEMAALQTEMIIIEDELDVAKATQSDTSTLLQQKAAKQLEINSKQVELSNVESDIDVADQSILNLQNTLKLENNFTPEQIIERNKFIIRRTWTDQNFINDEDLYEEAIKRFADLSKPQTVFNINIINFLEVVEEQRNWDKLNLGDTITIKYEKLGINVKAKIIEIAYNYESGDINLTIANVTEIESDENKLIKMLYQSYSTATSVDMNKYKWDDTKDKLGEINDIIEGTWSANERRIVAGVNESVTIDRRGITIRNQDFPNEVLIAQAGVLAISGDDGETWKNAITTTGTIKEKIKYGTVKLSSDLQY